MNIFLAGGAVRDLLMGNPITDRDYLVTDTTKEAFKKRFPSAQQVGKAFPVFLLDRLEFSFPRAATVQEELRSRDLTVNAILLSESGKLLCHPNALEDLHNRYLRPASPDSLKMDPLRVFRAARFWAKLPGFSPHDELVDAMRDVARSGLLETVSPDRVGQETVKALEAAKPGNYFRLLAQAGCLSPWFDEFQGGIEIPAGPEPYHDTNVIEHTCRIMDNLAGDPITVWMGMCHDLGKMRTKKEHLPRHHGHDKRGIRMVKSLSKRIRLSNAHLAAGVIAAKWHMIAARYDELQPGTRVDLLMDLHLSHALNQLFTLVRFDQNKDFTGAAQKDLNTILSATLPPEYMNLGATSGKILRELRSSALAKAAKL